ncbi:MAG: four helix bundle protein [Actinomycetota bacterium]
MEYWFDHERLNVYQEAIAFCAWWEGAAVRCRTFSSVREQLDRASTSIPLNIAEGNGKHSPRDRSRYFQIATGSALECAACLDVLAARGRLDAEIVGQGKRRLRPIVSMLMGLIGRNSGRVQEETTEYETDITPFE